MSVQWVGFVPAQSTLLALLYTHVQRPGTCMYMHGAIEHQVAIPCTTLYVCVSSRRFRQRGSSHKVGVG